MNIGTILIIALTLIKDILSYVNSKPANEVASFLEILNPVVQNISNLNDQLQQLKQTGGDFTNNQLIQSGQEMMQSLAQLLQEIQSMK